MAKNSAKQMEEDENKVIQELLKNANKSINEIAKICGFSRQKVWRIIKNLENNNTIWGYTAVVNEEKQNLKSYTILIKRTNLPTTQELADKITSKKMDDYAKKIGVNIDSSFYLYGPYDWMICFSAQNIKYAKKFSELLRFEFQEFIDDIILIEKMFAVKKCGINNPDIKQLDEFFTAL
jgi:DNA-binding Lrp family transcriptional regulator